MKLSINEFIKQYIIHRDKSMFVDDICDNHSRLSRKIKDRSVLVIGGAGSIGSSFIKAILQFEPSALCVVDTNENALTELTRDLRSSGAYMPTEYLTYPMDYASQTFKRMFVSHSRMITSINTCGHGFDIVANFSAHKHVRSEKDIYSVEALIRNNVINAKGLLDILFEYPPEEYFCVSTDKAANPVNIMGASKRIMEDLIFSYSDAFPVKTARFANVAFSNGSLPDGFLHRIERNQVLSAPSDVKRYFVSQEESGQICMLAAILGGNREIFFPKLDEQQMESFDHIAENLLREYGYEIKYCNTDEEAIRAAKDLSYGGKKYPVFFSMSDTSGEKTYEEFYVEGESVDLDSFKSLGVIKDKSKTDKKAVIELINTLDNAFVEGRTKEDIVSIITSYLPNFKHIEMGKNLDSKI